MAPDANPQLIVAGGPNGAGKTTFVGSFLSETPLTYLGADLIAYELCPDDVASVAVQAGRLFLRRVAEARGKRESVIIESTLSGKGFAREMQAFRQAGYDIRLIFISLPSAQASATRVALRVSKGGHDVPIEDIERRFQRTHLNFWELYRPIAHRWELFYNGGRRGHILVAEGEDLETWVSHSVYWNVFWEILNANQP